MITSDFSVIFPFASGARHFQSNGHLITNYLFIPSGPQLRFNPCQDVVGDRSKPATAPGFTVCGVSSSACLRDHRSEDKRDCIFDDAELPGLNQIRLELKRRGEIQHFLVRVVELCRSLYTRCIALEFA
jgi:hypothetical protein